MVAILTLSAQSYSPCYTEFMAKGNAAYNQGKYSEAKTYYAKAKQCAGGNPTEAQKRINQCNAKLNPAPKPSQPSASTPKTDQTFTVNGISFKLVYVQGGTFTMGCTSSQGGDCFDGEKPSHSVTLSDFWIGETEVTQALWKAVMGNNPSNFKGDNLPVENVSWNDCQNFVRNLNELTGNTFRLPTEAEWEYSASGGNKNRGYKYASGNSIEDVAWYTDNSGSATHSVKGKRANELGLYDMTGNVWEWCEDWYESYSSSSQTNPRSHSTGSNRVYRGGSWSNNAWNCRVSYRHGNSPGYRSSNLGFRLATVRQETTERQPTETRGCESQSQNKSPKIQFDQTSYDFGKIKEEDGKVTTRFYFTNVGGGELLLVSVRPGCGCTTTDYTKTAVGPGQRGYIDATYNPSNRPGAFNKNIKITTNEPEMQVEKPTPHMIFIKGEVLPKQSSETSNSGEKAKKEAEEERIKEEIRQADLYGNEDEMQRLRKSCSSKLTDYDGNTYNTVLIGKQCWMKENMRTTHYANGSSIPMGSTYSYTDAYRYCPDNNCSNVSTYGYLYNWAAMMKGSPSSDRRPSGVQGICPKGWHVPSEMEWKQMLFYVKEQPKYHCEDSKYRIAKSLSSTMGWYNSDKSCVVGNNPSTNNATGFSAFPAGRSLSKCCTSWGEKAYFWTSTQDKDNSAFNVFISYDSYSVIDVTIGSSKYYGYSVRCVKD
ncbi:MAG: SUMF1/EgtB/PvdO family nonheme iron enzyme [Bacteroidales bacterium]|nr:SUMF1/EgtB/PvdO family nonheme iron enzyme [Bacteroidales bacterium]